MWIYPLKMVDLSSSLCGYVSLPEDNTGELDTTRSTRSKMNEKNLENRLRGAIMPWNPWTKKTERPAFRAWHLRIPVSCEMGHHKYH